ncbi:M48 family metallopeptidase [Devosia sp.]|uniref:M48 family metallopeptidase n=1 Tax=Devosia sp. TaxID=1871048 RepID=UPI003BABBCF1
MPMNFLFPSKVPSGTFLTIDGARVEVSVKISARARSYRLTVPHHGHPVLTVPKHGRWNEAEAFLNRQVNWLATRLKRAAPRVTLADGEYVPLRGVRHRIHATGKLRGRVEIAEIDGEPVLLVPGDAEHLARRLIEWLKTEAHADLTERSAVHAATLSVAITSIAMRSQSTRWGSCSSSGKLNYNWRLILAPPHVLDYVAAHEVAHLLEMNHSPAFWEAVEDALPDMSRGRAWLKAHGKDLMAYGVS